MAKELDANADGNIDKDLMPTVDSPADGEVDAPISANWAYHQNVSNVARSSKDAYGVFTTIEYDRADATLMRKSVLSGGTAPYYTTRTVTHYDATGTIINALTEVYTLTYTDGLMTSEVLQ
jgi:hypothetical protein